VPVEKASEALDTTGGGVRRALRLLQGDGRNPVSSERART
jgi:hypothetical protein